MIAVYFNAMKEFEHLATFNNIKKCRKKNGDLCFRARREFTVEFSGNLCGRSRMNLH